MGKVTTTFDLYGLPSTDLEWGRQLVERALRIVLHLHESDYRGGDYYRSGRGGPEGIILQRNFNTHDQEWMEDDHRDVSLLLYVDGTSRSEEIRRLLENESDGICLLRHSEA